ncbi:MAG: type IV toxin-antitoxin system AbiEi family antitoxin domain-containing protein [Deltaproteobacteria bacterium]|nr:type IV toxin-antitoxin system AbiEi family antitoxin domain-containing protein [Deltaproteobacteria bacterium]
MRTREVLKAGIYQRTLYLMRQEGVIEPLARGVNHLVEIPLPPHVDLVIAALIAPKSTICLISALDFHGITTQIPHFVYLAVPKGTKAPKIRYPNVRIFTYSLKDLAAGITEHTVGNFKIRVSSPEKTVVDCFKYRNKIGLDVAIEALKLCVERTKTSPAKFLKYARIAKVNKIISPYLETLYA